MDRQQTPPVNGLVLAGGKSMRMGSDKALLRWHGIEQQYYMADLLQRICPAVFISCRQDQQSGINPLYSTLADSTPGLGPLSGILTAFGHNAQQAWLVTACDLPLLDPDTLQYLIRYRNPQSIATTFRCPHDGLPEPLITIWEPAGYPVLQQFAAKGITCPRKVLLNSPVTILEPPSPAALLNANTPADAEKVRAILQENAVSHAS